MKSSEPQEHDPLPAPAPGRCCRARLKDLASERHRFGYRRLNQMLKREGTVVNLKKVRRLYAEERLQVRRRKGRKKASGTRAPLVVPQAPDQRGTIRNLVRGAG